ncbi:MAG: flagellar hook-associated protein FlgK [Oceanicaulis sp.]
MALNGVIGNALSGLQAAQLGMRTASNNVANANTPGYARTEINQTARNSAGQGMGVEITGIERVTDRYLRAASMRAASDASAATVTAEALDRLQAQFGATDDEGSLFGRLNQAFASIGAAAADSAERVSRLSAASDLQSFFDEAQRLSAEVRALRDEADKRISAGVGRVNEILAELQDLNSEVQSLNASAADTTGAQNRQGELLDELSSLMDVKTEIQSDGRMFIRTENGVGLLDNSRLELGYVAAGTGAYGVDYGAITATVSASGAQLDLTPSIRSGEIRGFLNLRDAELPALAGGLAEFAAGAADALNAAHNGATTLPPPQLIEGRNTGLLGTDSIAGSGSAHLTLVHADGRLAVGGVVEIEATATGLTVNGTATTTIDQFVTALDGALGASMSASFADGRLTLTANTADYGIAMAQVDGDPLSIGGRGFSHFFGLNDLVESERPGFFETGLSAASPHGLNPGGALGFKVTTPDGVRALDVSVPVTGATLADQLAALNDPAGGLGRYGAFSLDAQGALSFTPGPGYGDYDIAVTADSTQRGTTGLSFSQLFGLGDAARMNRAEAFEVKPEIRADSSRFAFARLDTSPAGNIGDIVLTVGDNRGGQDLFSALNAKRSFNAAGGLAAGQASLAEYAARLAGDVGSRAARAERADMAAASVKTAADQKRADVEGVNLDEELARMTLYQQAYNASARLLQAAKEMTDTLLNI